MAIILAGSGPTVMNANSWSTNVAYRDSDYSSCSAYCSESAGGAGAELRTAIPDGTAFWVHFLSYYYQTGAYQTAARNLLVGKNSAGSNCFYITGRGAEASSYRTSCYLSVVSTAGAIGTSAAFDMPANAALLGFDINVYQDGANARADLYVSGTLIVTASVAGSVRGLKSLAFGAKNSYSTTFSTYSELIISTTDTRGLRARTLLPTANGIYGEWDGDYTAVDEAAAPDGLAVVSSSSAQRISFSKTALATGTNVGAVFVNALGSVAPGNDIQGGLRVAGADYYSDAMDMTSGMLPGNSVFLVNPATGVPFTAEELNSSEIILKSIEV